jgi:hypothetical protein
MPTKLKVLVALMALSIVLDVVNESWVMAVLHALLLLGVIRGNEGVRTLLMLLATIGLLAGGFVLVVAVIALTAGGALGTAVAALFGGAVGLGQAAYMLWCLRQADVQTWMFHRSLNLDV